MKRFAAVLLCCVVCAAYGKSLKAKHIPAPVKEAFKQECPNAEDVEWEKEGEKFEVSCEVNDMEMELLIDANGKIVEKETEIKPADLPQGAVDQLSSMYEGLRVREAEKVEKDGVVTYEVELVRKVEVVLDASGTFVEEEGEDGDHGHHDNKNDDHDDDDG